MVSTKELSARVADFLKFNRQEFIGIIGAIIVTAFVFSFRDWGVDEFSLSAGLTNLILIAVICLVSFIFRFSCQKIYALSQGYSTEFKVWWVGFIIMIVAAFLTDGHVPLVLIGSMSTALMVRQRLGEFRYGFSYAQEAVIGLWGVFGNMIMAVLFAAGLYFAPQSYFFHKGLILNLIMGFTSLLPLPQLDGLKIFFGKRLFYYLACATVLLTAVLLLSRTKFGLILAIVMGSVAGIIYIAVGSEK